MHETGKMKPGDTVDTPWGRAVIETVSVIPQSGGVDDAFEVPSWPWEDKAFVVVNLGPCERDGRRRWAYGRQIFKAAEREVA